MRLLSSRPLLALAALLVAAGPAPAVITALTPLAQIIENDDYIFVAAIDAVDPARPSAVFKVEKKLKGAPPYDRIPVNMTGNAEAKKANDTKTILDRLDPSRKAVFFVATAPASTEPISVRSSDASMRPASMSWTAWPRCSASRRPTC